MERSNGKFWKASYNQVIYGWVISDSITYVGKASKRQFGQQKGSTADYWRVTKSYRSTEGTTTSAASTISDSSKRSAAAPSSSSGGNVQVKGYYRKDGTYVRPHTRSAPRKKG